MNKKTRRIIFYLFLLVFIILVPLIIIYSLGYTFDKKTLVSTGGIYLKSYPNDADIFLDDKPKRKTNRFITHLKPKTYEVRVEKKNYHSWEKKLNSNMINLIIKIVLQTFILIPNH